jgi:hypothetical protein
MSDAELVGRIPALEVIAMTALGLCVSIPATTLTTGRRARYSDAGGPENPSSNFASCIPRSCQVLRQPSVDAVARNGTAGREVGKAKLNCTRHRADTPDVPNSAFQQSSR